ncbi:RidA family protein [Nesterenkonia sp. HG001]|uniref:RidA family protein n=1 Tax=Nesterenkonia sp. HG001 TaxID=2983207 RepID=UPI002AC65266|nr:Rid family hydrolase [Nesterenkonia sp. HG001]MDZ5078324.1 Rid family hydrolase [Nesterenkonia sp. HG001]
MDASPADRPSPVTLHRSATLSDVAEYAYASTVPAGARLAFLAGSCPLDADGRTVAVGDVAGQAHRCVENLRTVLSELGADLSHVATTRVLVASSRQQDLVAAWEVVRDSFGAHDVPSTLVGVAALGYDDQLVEIESTAVVDAEPTAQLTPSASWMGPETK